MLIKVYLTLEIDEEEYPVPVDGFIDEEVTDALQEFVYDIDGMSIKHIKLLTQ
jgi:hypothetical protein